ncbi:MAG: hypothetical protein GXW99_11750 [Clostridiales bacterium]|nr:hypothetical protein [Clostridiales bacterium]
MNIRKKYLALALAVTVVLAAAIGMTLAYTQYSGTPVNTQISTQSLSISLNSAEVPQTKTLTYDSLVPGAQLNQNFTVTNSANTALYTRVTIDKSWGSQNGAASYQKDFKADGKLITVDADKLDGWIVAYEDSEQMVLYYSRPLAAGESTTSVLGGIGVSSDVDNQYADKNVELSVTAEAVQSFDAKTAMRSAWGVTASFAGDGTLTGVAE